MKYETSTIETNLFKPWFMRLFHKNWIAVTAMLIFHIALIFIERTLALVSIWLYIVFVLQPQGKPVIGLKKPQQKTWWIWAPIIGLATVGITAMILWAMLGWENNNMFYDMARYVGDGYLLLPVNTLHIARITLLIIFWQIGPFLEEPLFRGFTQSVFAKKIGIRYAILLQALLFALIHPLSNISWFVSIFAAGIVYGIIVNKSKSLWPAVLAHSAYNLGILWISFTFLPHLVY